jgi:hypothetical protein
MNQLPHLSEAIAPLAQAPSSLMISPVRARDMLAIRRELLAGGGGKGATSGVAES